MKLSLASKIVLHRLVPTVLHKGNTLGRLCLYIVEKLRFLVYMQYMYVCMCVYVCMYVIYVCMYIYIYQIINLNYNLTITFSL